MTATGSITPVADLDEATVSSMFELMSRYFAHVDRGQFEKDLAEKDDIVLIHADGTVVGFSTMQLREESINGQTIRVLFSGDTIIDAQHWNTLELQRQFVLKATTAMRESSLPLYWFLICGGYRTYRYLPTFFREFWPRHDRATPQEHQALIDSLARKRFGSNYQDGVVVASNGHLRDGVSPIEERQLRNPHVAFFVKANPGHMHGHELVCLAQVSESNITRVAARMQAGN